MTEAGGSSEASPGEPQSPQLTPTPIWNVRLRLWPGHPPPLHSGHELGPWSLQGRTAPGTSAAAAPSPARSSRRLRLPNSGQPRGGQRGLCGRSGQSRSHSCTQLSPVNTDREAQHPQVVTTGNTHAHTRTHTHTRLQQSCMRFWRSEGRSVRSGLFVAPFTG